MSDPAQAKDAALTRMAADLSHQLNNILAVVKGNVTFLREAAPLAHLDEILTDVESATETAITLSSRLQQFAGRSVLRPARVDFKELVKSAASQLKTTYPDKRFHATVNDAPCIVELDARHALDAIFELVRNALAAHCRNVWMELTVQAGAEYCRAGQRLAALHIRDDGQGMAPDILRRAQEPLFTTRRQGAERSGWGLSIVAGFVRQSGGVLEIGSVRGRGTGIDIYLPCSD